MIVQKELIMGKYFGTDGFRGEANVDLRKSLHFIPVSYIYDNLVK